MFGGADPVSAACVPQDVTLRGNHIMRPTTWFKVWQIKNLIETKDVIRYLIEGNVIENEWADAQVGFAIVMKSENQQGGAPYTITRDVTMRYNLIRNVSSVWNLSGHGSNTAPSGPSTRFDIHDNVVKNVRPNASTWGGQGVVWQLLTDLHSAHIYRNTVYSDASSNTAITFDGAPVDSLDFRGNVVHHGAYGVKGGGTSDGSVTLAKFAPGATFTDNVIVGGGSCTQYPAGNTCPAAFPAPSIGVGADEAKVAAFTAGAVVAP
jgi:hypothetical protein